MRILRRRKVTFLCMVVSTTLIGLAVAVPASATASTDGDSFLAVRSDNQTLNKWYRDVGGNFSGEWIMGGWDNNARLVTGMYEGRFLEVKNDGELVSWDLGETGWLAETIDWGWTDARLITNLDENLFLEVKNNGELWEWNYSLNTGLSGHWVMSGWGNARLIAGLADGYFVEVTSDTGQLVEWLPNGNTFMAWPHDYGWGNARLIAGLNIDQFVEVRYDGNLYQYTYDGHSGYNAKLMMGGWGNVRLLG
jgi:hypothetical protein